MRNFYIKDFFRIDEIVMMELPINLRFSFKLYKTKEILLILQNIDDLEKLVLKFDKNTFLSKILKRKIEVKSVNEMNLAGNQYKTQSEKYKLNWTTTEINDHEENMVKTFEEKQKRIKEQLEFMDDEKALTFSPLETRVFLIAFS